ncbi:hypothetical protein B0I00_1411 [Novosphingobium kunmingense]|uniref:Uncharacterized protein n=1 Tax=Novosphingobium kunmingense TaxID=1211806 RepID=A0A2N0HJQ7_9SPHN|nr:hypothetical protein [Novosphingobium kunmingense]PKB19181.1 hypothetical protein B0I00_1411 [Novosphingobium kunmingense]
MDEPDNLPPEARNPSQDDAADQSQTLADEAKGRASAFEFGDSERTPGPAGDETGSAPDVVDHMNQMVSSGHIDMSAYRGERMDDDEDDGLGPEGLEDDFIRGAE